MTRRANVIQPTTIRQIPISSGSRTDEFLIGLTQTAPWSAYFPGQGALSRENMMRHGQWTEEPPIRIGGAQSRAATSTPTPADIGHFLEIWRILGGAGGDPRLAHNRVAAWLESLAARR